MQVSGGHRPFSLDTHANNTFHPQPTADWLEEEEENAPGNNGADGPAFVQITVRPPRLSPNQQQQRIHPANNNNNRIIGRPTSGQAKITGPRPGILPIKIKFHKSRQEFLLQITHISAGLKSKGENEVKIAKAERWNKQFSLSSPRVCPFSHSCDQRKMLASHRKSKTTTKTN